MLKDKRLEQLFDGLARYGKNDAGGLDRLTWSPAFMEAQSWLRHQFVCVGAEIRRDSFGNLFGIFPGRRRGLAPLLVGSHLDSVPNGGRFDGALGVITGLECFFRWRDDNWQPERDVVLVAFAEEEGTRFGKVCLGSRFICGELTEDETKKMLTASGEDLGALISAAGMEVSHPSADYFALTRPPCGYLELHIEQGAYLDEGDVKLGIVSAIVGIRHLTLRLQGEANHAGTTAMTRRHDALVAAASVISHAYEGALASGGEYVATAGFCDVQPGTLNVVPGTVTLGLEIRSERDEVVEKIANELLNFARKAGERCGVTMTLEHEDTVRAVPMDSRLRSALTESARELGVPFRNLPSWAGHDAMVMARHMPGAMLFVPSRGGLSHCPEEFTSLQEMTTGCAVLDKALRKLSGTKPV